MSYSISNLFKALAENPKQADTKLENPDIPISTTQARDRKFIRDQSHNALRLGSQPRNGDGYLLPRTTFDNDPRKDSFLMERSIDPDVIRQKVNPISEGAPQMIEGGLYGIDSTMKQASDSINLIRNSQEQFYNYQNRFSMMPTENLPPVNLDISKPNQPTQPIDIPKPIPKPAIGYTPPANIIQTLPAKKQGTGRGDGGGGI
jgi:hypothetical protein